MRILIIGAGIAGLTLAAKLRQQGRDPVVVERAERLGDTGYAIALYPMGSCVLHGLGRHDELMSRGLTSKRFEMADGRGRTLQAMDVSVLTAGTGSMVMLSRAELVDVLRESCGDLPIRLGTTVTTLTDLGEAVRVEFSDGTSEEFDLVVGCDGMNSRLRRTIGATEQRFDSKWALLTWWGASGIVSDEEAREFWGRGWFLGAYPTPGRCMFGVGMADSAVGESAEAEHEAAAKVLAELATHLPRFGSALDGVTDLYRWPMADVRSSRWYSGRIALCGDAAVSFMPTAGVGASVALRSAAALADELSRADAASLPRALELYVKRCQRVVEGNQQNSRSLSRAMFIDSEVLGWGRDQVMRHYPVKLALKQITESFRLPF